MILGKDCFKEADQIARFVGYLPGEIAFIDSMTGMEFIRFIARMKGMKELGRAHQLMERFELDPSPKIRENVPRNQAEKIGIVCAFMQDPDILLLDEPTSGLDPLMQSAFIDLILDEKKKGKTILLSSHIFEEVERTCDRAAIIREGRLAAVEDIEKLRQNKRKIVELQFPSADTARDFASRMPSARQNEESVTVKVKGIWMPWFVLAS